MQQKRRIIMKHIKFLLIALTLLLLNPLQAVSDFFNNSGVTNSWIVLPSNDSMDTRNVKDGKWSVRVEQESSTRTVIILEDDSYEYVEHGKIEAVLVNQLSQSFPPLDKAAPRIKSI